MKERKRKFKLRNGMVVAGPGFDPPRFETVRAFQEIGGLEEFFPVGKEIFLFDLLFETGFPGGGAYGEEFDIIEELFNEV